MLNGKILSGDRFRFKANPPWKDEDVVKSVAKIILGTEEFHEQRSGYKWMLGGSNDWWMDKDQETGEFVLAWRYCGGANTVRMQLLYHVILWRLGFEHFNEEAKTKMSRQERLEWLKRYFLAFLAERPHGPGAPTPFDYEILNAFKALEEKYKDE